MNSLIRTIALVLGLSFLAGNAWTQASLEERPVQDEGTAISKEQNTTADIAPELGKIETAIRALVAEEDKIEQERLREQATRALDAQETMAHWSEWMFYATALTVILTLVALWAVIRTLHHTGRAANYTGEMLKEAKAATKAAQDTLEVTRAMGQRPWLSVEIEQEGNIELTKNGFAEDGVPLKEIWFKIRNAGNGPAIIEVLHRRWSVCNEKRLPDPITPSGKSKGGKSKSAALPIGGAGTSGSIRTTYETSFPFEKLRANSRVFFDGYIEFRDSADVRYVAGFCIIFESGRFHAAWPRIDPEKYHYHYRIEDEGKPILAVPAN